VKLLVVVTNYPHPGHPSAGAFNARSARALQALGHCIEVLAPRPYVPHALAFCHSRWRAYNKIIEHETRDGLMIYRPAYFQLPGTGGALRPDWCAYLACVRRLADRHKNITYDAILAFNLVVAGGVAWRLARRFGIPAAGWATGNDVRVPANSAHGRAVRAALERLDLKFYQSTELLERAAALCGSSRQALSTQCHFVLPRGVAAAPAPSPEMRGSVRASLGLQPDQLMVLYVGRMVKAKGVFDLIEAVDAARRQRRDLVCVLVGAHDGFDESAELRKLLQSMPQLSPSTKVLPACAPESVWQYLNAADIFAFPSHSEGMPNSLLEAMAAGLPAVAYAIAPVLEIDDRLGVLKLVPPADVSELARALIVLADSSELRSSLGASGRARVLSRYLMQTTMAEALRRLGALTGRESAIRSLPKSVPMWPVPPRGDAR
jgi:teichuronic acid biosynthesis glycosyltransferase TuaC